MNRQTTLAAMASALATCACIASAESMPRAEDSTAWRVTPGAGPIPSATQGHCRLQIYVDGRATVSLHGDQIVVRTDSGQRSYDRGSYCNQPLPSHDVGDFRVTAAQGRGHITDVRAPSRANDFTGAVAISDPAPAGEVYVIDVAWSSPSQPLAAATYPKLDAAGECQEEIRMDFFARNAGDAGLEFRGPVAREAYAQGRERISGDAWARNNVESRPVRYECTIDSRADRVIASRYEMREGRWTSALR